MKATLLRCSTGILIAAVFAGVTPAAMVHVPADQPTVQAGIDAAGLWDTVLVAEGTYVENVRITNPVYLASHYLLDGDTAHLTRTILDGSSPTSPDTASVIVMIYSADATVQGFTITGGRGTRWQDQADGLYYREGGGILTEGGMPRILDNFVIGNEAVDVADGLRSAGGGAIRCGYGTAVIENNVLAYNTAHYGGAVVLFHNPGTLRNNLIYRNRGGKDFGGGGIWITSCEGSNAVVNNTISENVSALDGGGVLIWDNTVDLQNNVIWGNVAGNGPQIRLRSGASGTTVSYSNVEGGWVGTTNIDAPPEFEPENCILSETSAGVDVGDTALAMNDPADPIQPVMARYPARGGRRNDMGVYGGPDCKAFPVFTAPGADVPVAVVDFDTVDVHASGTRYAGLAKSAYGVVEFNQVEMAGTFVADLELTTNLPVRLGPATTDNADSIAITWSPTTYGIMADTMLIHHDDGSVPGPFVVILQGLAPGRTGDANLDDVINSSDVIYLVNYVFKGGATPLPVERAGDVDCSGLITSSDVIFMVSYVFKGGPAPCP